MADETMNEFERRAVAAQEAALDAMKAIADQAAYDRAAAEEAEARIKTWREEEMRKRDEAEAGAAKGRADYLALGKEQNALLLRIAEALENH